MPIISNGVPVQVQTNKDADLTVKIAGDLAAAKLDLFTNNITPNALRVIGDFDIPTFTGYAQKAVTGWGGTQFNANGSVTVNATNVVQWVGPGDGTGQTVYGYLIRDAAGGNPLIAAYLFAAPVAIEEVTDVLNLVASYTIQ